VIPERRNPERGVRRITGLDRHRHGEHASCVVGSSGPASGGAGSATAVGAAAPLMHAAIDITIPPENTTFASRTS
jgi:hypothetical protein